MNAFQIPPRRAVLALSLGLVLLQAAPAASALSPVPARAASGRTVVLTISAMIDGRSTLTIAGRTAVWSHFQEAAPGLHEGANAPTMIGATSWLPKWPQVGENRNCGCSSSVFKGVSPPLPSTGPIAFQAVSCRESCTGTAGSGRAVINFDDVAIASDAQYTVTLTYQVPSKTVVLSGTVRSQKCATDAAGAAIKPCKLELAPAGGKVVEVGGVGGSARTRTASDGTYSVTVKKGRHTLRVSGSGAVVIPGSRTVNAKADVGNLDFLVPSRPYAITMTGLARDTAVGPLPTPISPASVAFGDTVDFALQGWDPTGGPVDVSWGSKRLGALRPDPTGGAAGQFKIENFQHRGTLRAPKPCTGSLTATQGGHTRRLKFTSVERGAIVLKERTHSPLKADDLYCLGEIETLPTEFAPAGGAIIYTSPFAPGSLLPRDLKHSSNLVPMTIRDDLTHVQAIAVASFRGRLCVRLGASRWVVISIPLPGEIRTITHSAPCVPGPTRPSPYGPFVVPFAQTITTAPSKLEVLDALYVFTTSVVFPKAVTCLNCRLYGDEDMSFPVGFTGDGVLYARGSIEIIGPLALQTTEPSFELFAEGDTVLWGSGG